MMYWLQPNGCTDVPGLDTHLGSASRRAYVGFDPTADSLTIGNLVGLVALTYWAFPFGTLGGGGPQRGGFVVPDIGADVVVMFLGGDLERPIYSPAWWSYRNGAKEMPAPARDAAEHAHQVQSIQLGRLLIAVDERDGQRKLFLRA